MGQVVSCVTPWMTFININDGSGVPCGWKCGGHDIPACYA